MIITSDSVSELFALKAAFARSHTNGGEISRMKNTTMLLSLKTMEVQVTTDQ